MNIVMMFCAPQDPVEHFIQLLWTILVVDDDDDDNYHYGLILIRRWIQGQHRDKEELEGWKREPPSCCPHGPGDAGDIPYVL